MLLLVPRETDELSDTTSLQYVHSLVINSILLMPGESLRKKLLRCRAISITAFFVSRTGQRQSPSVLGRSQAAADLCLVFQPGADSSSADAPHQLSTNSGACCAAGCSVITFVTQLE